jgi:hypothetical protein
MGIFQIYVSTNKVTFKLGAVVFVVKSYEVL